MSYNFCRTNASQGDEPTPASAPAPAPAPESAPATNQLKSSAQGANPSRGNNITGNDATEGAANYPNLAVNITVADLQAIQRRIADLKEAVQRNSCFRWRSESEPDYERAPKRPNLKSKAPDEYWRENRQKLDVFICQWKNNFWINEYTQHKTRIAYLGSYCHGTRLTQ